MLKSIDVANGRAIERSVRSADGVACLLLSLPRQHATATPPRHNDAAVI